MVFLLNPFEDVLIDYNGYDETTNPVTSGSSPNSTGSCTAAGPPTMAGTNSTSTAMGTR